MDERTPERIYGWRDSQLSIARHYGGCTFNGAKYVIAPDEEGQPLVREDVLKRERRRKKAKPWTKPVGELEPGDLGLSHWPC